MKGEDVCQDNIDKYRFLFLQRLVSSIFCWIINDLVLN